MLKKDLAEELGISPAMVTKLTKRGMPSDTPEAAREWRRRNLEPGKVKPGTAYPRAVPASPVRVSAATADATVNEAQWAMDTAHARLAEGAGIALMIPVLRRSLAAVPESHRPMVAWSMPVAVALTRHAYGVLDVTEPCDDQEQASMTAAEAEEMGAFWYQVAAGELLSDGLQR